MKKIKFVLISLIIFFAGMNIFSVPKIKLSTNKGPDFQIGDLFEVKVDLVDNDGAYGAFIDLRYDNTVFELVDAYYGDILPEVTDQSENQMAIAPYNQGGRVIISTSLVGDRDLFTHNGIIGRLVFKAIRGGSKQSIILESDITGLYINKMVKKNIEVLNLTGLTVIGPYTNYFIQIISPYNNYKSNTNKLDYQIQATIQNPNYNDEFKVGLKKVTYYDEGAPIYSGSNEIFVPLNSGQAYFSANMNGMFEFNPGYNYVVATLYVNGQKKAAAVKRIYYEVIDRGVKITSPINNYITGRSIVTVEGESTFEKVLINNVLIETKKISNEKYTFVYDRLKLKEGFNKIVARTYNPQAEEIVYTDTITIYYQRDETIFDFIDPIEDQVFKSGKINIKGVIDTIDKDLVQVKMRAYFKSFGIGNDLFYVFKDSDNLESQISLRELENEENFLLSHYVFTADFDMSLLAEYGSGRLTFYAIKVDKTGKNPDMEISRSVVIDSEKLKIDLKQPNLFSEENIKKKSELSKYYDPSEYNPEDNNIDVSDIARITLIKNKSPKVYDDTTLLGAQIKEHIITRDGNNYAIVNSIPNRVDIYKKKTTELYFNSATKKTFYNAYVNCAVELGNNNILLGISDYNAGTNYPSGLVLYNNNILRSAKLPFEINHVQYIRKVGTDYFIYSSNYTYLYKFNEADVIVNQYDTQFFEIRNVKKFYLPNNLFINGFEVTNKGNTVILGTELSQGTDLGIKIYQYSSYNNVYNLVKEFHKDKDILKLAKAELQTNYNVYLFAYKAINDAQIYFACITERDNSKYGITECDQLNIYSEVYAIKQVKNNKFLIYGKDKDNNITLRTVDVFNGTSNLTDLNLSSLVIPGNFNTAGKTNINFINNNNFSIYGSGIISAIEEYVDKDGEINLLISDKNVDGIIGFSFDAPVIYEDLIEIKYVLTDNSSDECKTLFKSAGRSIGGDGLSRYEFSDYKGYKYLKLNIKLKRGQNGLCAPFIENLTIKKKEIVKTTSDTMEIKGFILDKTVGEADFTINSEIIKIEENGSFYHTININKDESNKETMVKLYASNKSGEMDEIEFRVIYVSNDPTLDNISLNYDNVIQNITTYPIDATNDFNPVNTTSKKITITGGFSGLYGVQVSAELYTLDAKNDISKFIWSYNSVFKDTTEFSGITSGNFEINNVELIPGNQRVILRCMNPYGTKKELKFDINFDVETEEVVISNFEIIDNNINQVFDVPKNNEGKYIKTFELTGKVITNKPLDFINLRSDNPYISFSKLDTKDVKSIKVALGEIGKTFSVLVNLKMEDQEEKLNECFKIWPDSLQLANLGRNIYVKFNKVFSDIYPDFSVTEFNNETGKINLKFKFNESVPNKLLIRLRLNREEINNNAIYLPIKNKASNDYFIYDGTSYTYKEPLQAKDGINIVDWWFYQDYEVFNSYNTNDKLLSSSGVDKYLSFNYDKNSAYTDLAVDFPKADIFYNEKALNEDPLIIDFDSRGTLEVKVNDNNINLSNYTQGNKVNIDLTKTPVSDLLFQGINKIEVKYLFDAKNIDQYQKCEFKYDSLKPEVKITSIDSIYDFVAPYVRSITVEVTEKNLKKVNLVYNNSVVDNSNPKITITEDGNFLYQWNNLETFNLLPSKEKELFIEAVDITDISGISEKINSGLYMYYDIQLSNKLSDTKVLNFKEFFDIGGTDDATTDFSLYRNEFDKAFDFHLKYETTNFFDINGNSLREDITDNFTKERIFNSDKKYIMFEFDSEEGINDIDLYYRRQNTITKDAAVTPVDMFEHTGYSNIDYINVYGNSVIKGHETIGNKYDGFAKDIKIYNDYAFVLDYLDYVNRDIDNKVDYKAVIAYKLLTKGTKPGIPQIISVLDDQSSDRTIQNVNNFRIYDNYIYLVCGNDGLIIYDLGEFKSNSTPKFKYVTKINPENAENAKCYVYDFVKRGNYLYLALGNDGIKIYDVSYIVNPKLVSDNILSSKPVAIETKDNYNAIFVLTLDKMLVKYNVSGEQDKLPQVNIAINPVQLTIDKINEAKIWFIGNNLYVLPCINIKPLIYNSETLVYSGENSFICNNKPDISNNGDVYYPSQNGIIVNNNQGNYLEKGITYTSYGVASNDAVIYSVNGDRGLRVIYADSDKTDDFGGSSLPSGWINNSSTIGPIYGSYYVSLPYNMGSSSSIIKYLDPPVFVDPSKEIKIYLDLNPNTNQQSQFSILIKLKDYGVVRKTFYFNTGNPSIGYSGANIVLMDGSGNFYEKIIKLSDFGISTPYAIESVELKNDMIYDRTGGTANICYIDYIVLPVYRAFDMPLAHAAFIIDNVQAGDISKADVNMGLIHENDDKLFKTESGKVIRYYKLSEKEIEKAFNEFSSNKEMYDKDFIPIEYQADYFNSTRLANYKTAQCWDDQVDDAQSPVTVVNTYNSDKFDVTFESYCQRRIDEDVNSIKVGEATEEIVLLKGENTPIEKGKYKIYLTDTLIVQPQTNGERISEKTRKNIDIPRGKNGAISFWLKLEEEIPWFFNYEEKTNQFWRDYNTQIGKPIVIWGDEDNSKANYRFVVNPKYLAFVQYKINSNMTDTDFENGNAIFREIDYTNNTNNFYGNWHMVTLTWDNTGALTMYVDDKIANENPIRFNNFDFSRFLNEKIVFGDVGYNVDSLYYSIASPKVFNRTLTLNDVKALKAAFNRLQGKGADLEILFNNNLNITKLNDSADDLISDNPVYEDTINGSGFVATNGITNYISSDLQNKRLMLTNNFNYSNLIKDNADAVYDEALNKMTLKRIDTGTSGIYHLTNGGGSGLGIPGSESYTFFGTLLTTDLSENDVCIIKINGTEKRFQLKAGDFKFTYDGINGVLSSIDIYFIFNKDLEFKANGFGFNAGRYKGNTYNSYPSNYLQMRHKFYHKESVVVYYKPLFENEYELNNKEIVIIDSRLYKIGISNNKYYAILKTKEGDKKLESNMMINNNIHQLAIVYDFSSSTFKFYIDSKIEAQYSGDTFTMPDFVGIFPDVYNITPGGNMDGSIKADGLLDEMDIYSDIILEGKLQSDYINKTQVVRINNGPVYDNSNVSIDINNNLEAPIIISYSFDNGESGSVNLGAKSSGSIMGSFTVGNHTLNMDINTGSVKKKETYKFVVSYAPIVRLVNAKSLIIKGDSDFTFKLDRDIVNSFAEQKEFIEVKLYMSDSLDNIDSNMVQIIKEDRQYSNFGKYFRDNNYNTLTDEIKFIINYQVNSSANKIYYKIKSYYYGKENNSYIINGGIKVLDIENPTVEYDSITKRACRVSTVISDYDPAKDSTEGITCNYFIKKLDEDSQEFSIDIDSGVLFFNDSGKVVLNVYGYSQLGKYKVIFEPIDSNGKKVISKSVEYTNSVYDEEDNPLVSSSWMDDLELILIDSENNLCKYNLNCGVTNLQGTYSIKVVLESNQSNSITLIDEVLNEDTFQQIINTENLIVGAEYTLKASLVYNGETIEKVEKFRYYGMSVDLRIVHGAVGYISYNNIYFNWEGFLDNKLDSRVQYRYLIDNSPWGGKPDENHVEFYNLKDGAHIFKVQAYYGEQNSVVYSPIKANTFVIDTKKPVIDESKITISEVYSSDKIVSHLKLEALEGTVTDDTLAGVLVNGNVVEVKKGGFKVDEIPLEKDGKNVITIEAIDLLGNVTKITKTYIFEVLEITYPPTIADINNPQENEYVKYSPLTVYGKVSEKVNINDNFKIYVDDPYGKREAIINFDRTFFIENVKINPGSKFKSIITVLNFVTDLGNGKIMTKEYPVYAKDVIKPVELELSIHAVSGGADTTEVKMVGTTDVKNVACWSFDYDGNGVYEDDYFTNEQTITVFYRYSDVGIIHPRVRVVTTDNHIFSGEDTLIIHDKIIKADLKDIEGVKSIDIIEVDDPSNKDVDGYEYVYLLQKMNNNNIIKRYIIEANNSVLLDNNSIYVNLQQLSINNPRSIKVDKNGDIYVAGLYGSGSKLYKLVKTKTAYIIDNSFNITLSSEVISSFDIDENHVYITLEKSNDIIKHKKDSTLIERKSPVMDGIIEDLGQDACIEAANDKLWLSDYMKQRVLSISKDGLKIRDFFGEPGNEEGQFISPKLLRVKGNYIYVFDQSEKTIQVFEKTTDNYRIVCRIDYTADYLPEGFLNYITDFAVFTKLENKKEYHYLALVNNNAQQVALLRIPKWEPNSVKVKSNIVTYVNNNEIFTSKPDGADAKKIFSSGSLPGVDGNVDYPSIAPDGTTLVFVSRIERYEYLEESEGFVFRKYDKLYLIDVDGKNCRLIDDPAINGKEIDRPQFSYNGSKIIFSAKGGGDYWTIYEYNIKASVITKLFNPSGDCMRPTYSPDDRYIAYVTKYYNHNEIMIFDTERPQLLISLTNNDYSDDYPVWSPVYDGETTVQDIKSKIAFISKPNFSEKIFYTYIAQGSSGDFRVVKKDGADIGDNPDSARNELENIDYQSLGTISYPCFTSDCKTIIFETYNNGITKLMQYDMSLKSTSATGIPEGSRRPSGMKNRIVNFETKVVDGNNIQLTWNRYAKEDLIYTVAYKSSENNANWVEKSFKSQDSALIEDLKMGMTYFVRVFVKDLLRGGDVTTSITKKVVIYPVIAKPIVTIDANNPYLIKMNAWKPETDKPWEYQWKFRWYIDNYKIEETYSDFTEYEFGTSGVKRIALEASLESDASKTHRSDDIFIDIIGDLKPVIVYDLIEENGSTSVKLDATKSSGMKLDSNTYKWKLSGSNVNGNLPPEEFTGATVIRNLDNYKGNLYVTLTVTSLPVMGQVELIREEKSIVEMIPLGLRDIKPVIIDTADINDKTLYTFDGSNSVGNIDWSTSSWEVFGPDNLYYQTQGKTGFTYNFPERNEDTNYTVVLIARNRASSQTVSATKMITVGEVPVVPVIDYKVITTTTANEEIVTAKLLLSAASSRGNDIDWSSIRWNVPLAGDYGGSSTQTGPTAVYNLYNIKKGISVDVNLTMQKRNSTEIIQSSEVITIKNGEVPAIEPYIEIIKDECLNTYETSEGDVYIFSALKSKGANIDWNNVQWLIDGQYAKQGSSVRLDMKDSGNKESIVVTLTLNSTGGGQPVTKTMSYNLKASKIDVVITQKVTQSGLNAGIRGVVTLSVRDSIGKNIDWERTKWFIYQGPENIVEKYGAEIVHSFPISKDIEYYPISVQMFYKGSTKLFVKNANIRVEGDKLQAIIKEKYDAELTEANKYSRTFTATDSLGENIDWQNCKWTFGDSSEYQYGPVASHKYSVDRVDGSYLVTLTIQRRTKDGKTEVSTDTYTVNIGKDEMVANIKAIRSGDYVIFSAEESTGRGLLLDRSVWAFEGADSENYSESDSESSSESSSESTSNSFNFNNNISTGFGTQVGVSDSGGTGLVALTNFNFQYSADFGRSNGTGSESGSSESNSVSQSSGESSNNIYSGASCRKMITGWTAKKVTLVIYRLLPDGTIEAQSKSFVYTVGQSDVTIIR